MPFEVAQKLGFIPINPVAAVEPLKDRSAKSGREPFTTQEVVHLVESAQGDWRGAVLLGATSGLRLSDVANLYWESVDFSNDLLRIETGKTGKVVVLPMHPDFARVAVRKSARDWQGSCVPGAGWRAHRRGRGIVSPVP